MTTTFTLALPWSKPELSPNKRLHWAVRSRITRQRRADASTLARAAKLPTAAHVTVTMHYQPARNWRIDAINISLDTKAAIDGLVDAGLIPDDTPRYLTNPEAIIHDAVKGEPGRMWLEIVYDTTEENAA